MKSVALRQRQASPKRAIKSSGAKAFDTFEMANLYPRDTGLPMTIWVSPKGRARHDARIKVCLTPGDRMDAGHTAVVAVRPEPRLVSGALPARDFAPVARWVRINAEALIDYWDGTLSTVELVHRLRRLGA